MSNSPRHRTNYVAIFWWLLTFTLVEVAVVLLPVPRMLTAILLVGFALSKATLVAMYFMHLRFERLTLSVIAFTPLLLCIFLVLVLLPDLSTVTGPSTIPTQKVVFQK